MAFNTVIQQGKFTATGNNITLAIRSEFDWMWIYNYTVIAAAGGGDGAQFYWQRDMPSTGLEYIKLAADDSITVGVGAQANFTLVDSTNVNQIGNPVATTAITNVVKPIVSATTANIPLVAGDVVRLSTTPELLNIMGVDFTVDTINAGNFRLAYALANAPGAVGTNGFVRRIPFNPYFYPASRYVCNITQAAQAVVTMTVRHNYKVGQKVRFVVPDAFGMTQMNGLIGTVVAAPTPTLGGASTNTITVDIDSSAFTAFAVPAPGDVPFSWAQVVPLGENTAFALSQGVDILSDATVNTGYVGVTLTAGANAPAGVTNDVIYWIAGKSFFVDSDGSYVVSST